MNKKTNNTEEILILTIENKTKNDDVLRSEFVVISYNEETEKYILLHRSTMIKVERFKQEIEHIEEFQESIDRYDPIHEITRRANTMRRFYEAHEYLEGLKNGSSGKSSGKGSIDRSNKPKIF